MMSYLVVSITKIAKLEYRLGNLIIRDEGYRSICIDDISILIIESTAVSLTASLLSELIKKKVKIIFCDEKRNPSGELVPYYGSHDSSGKIKQQLLWNTNIKEKVGRELIKDKIRKQGQLAKRYNIDIGITIEQMAERVEEFDKTCREAHAAKLYFKELFGSNFNRVSSTPTNACLNYGYTLLLSIFNKKIVASGYLTQLGLYHRNDSNQFNLSCDLVEPWRVLIDAKVKSMSPKIFSKDEKIELLSILTQDILIARKKYRLENAIDIYSKSIFMALENEDINKIRFFELL